VAYNAAAAASFPLGDVAMTPLSSPSAATVPEAALSGDTAPSGVHTEGGGSILASLRADLSAMRRQRIAELLMFFPVHQRTTLSYQIGNLEVPSSLVLGTATDRVALVALAHVVHVLQLLSAYLGERLPCDMRPPRLRGGRTMTRAMGCGPVPNPDFVPWC
jgi:hypothetical protein